jgi:hypothetical protein
MTLGPKSGQVVCQTKIVTLRPQKVGHSVTVEHSDPLVILVSIVCDTASPMSPRVSHFFRADVGLWAFFK